MIRTLLLLGALASAASADILATPTVKLATAQAATGGSANQLNLTGATGGVIVCGKETGTTTWAIEGSPDGGTTWATWTEGTTALSFADVDRCVPIGTAPAGMLLRTNVTTCSTCAFTAWVVTGAR